MLDQQFSGGEVANLTLPVAEGNSIVPTGRTKQVDSARRQKVFLVLMGCLSIFLVVAFVVAHPGSSSSSRAGLIAARDTPPSGKTDQAAPVRTLQPLLSLSGSGSKSTQVVTVPSEWQLAWRYDCSAFGTQGNFMVMVYNSDGSMSDAGMVNQLGGSGSDTEYFHQGGTLYLQVNSECRWTIKVLG